MVLALYQESLHRNEVFWHRVWGWGMFDGVKWAKKSLLVTETGRQTDCQYQYLLSLLVFYFSDGWGGDQSTTPPAPTCLPPLQLSSKLSYWQVDDKCSGWSKVWQSGGLWTWPRDQTGPIITNTSLSIGLSFESSLVNIVTLLYH